MALVVPAKRALLQAAASSRWTLKEPHNSKSGGKALHASLFSIGGVESTAWGHDFVREASEDVPPEQLTATINMQLEQLEKGVRVLFYEDTNWFNTHRQVQQRSSIHTSTAPPPVGCQLSHCVTLLLCRCGCCCCAAAPGTCCGTMLTGVRSTVPVTTGSTRLRRQHSTSSTSWTPSKSSAAASAQRRTPCCRRCDRMWPQCCSASPAGSASQSAPSACCKAPASTSCTRPSSKPRTTSTRSCAQPARSTMQHSQGGLGVMMGDHRATVAGC